MEMALAAEQPLKKRKLYDPVQEPPQSLPQGQEGGFVSPPPSQDEILRKRRNKDEIRNLYDSYRRIKYCVSQKDDRFRPDFEQAYLSLITASRGCSSVLRILAQLIPRYASHCPTALEAAAKVAINMYNWSVALVVRGEDSDGVAFQTAKACVFGLVEICGIASSEAPTSSVIQGICSAVFLIVLNFFVTSFDGKDIYKIGYKSIAKLQDSSTFLELKQEVAEEHGSTLSKLFNFRALSLLRIFFCCPKNLLAACFEAFKTSEADVASQRCGTYFLRQITSLIGAADESHLLDKVSDGVRSHSVSIETFNEADGINAEKTVSNHSQIQDYASLQTKNCLVRMVLSKDPSLRDWFLSKYKNFSKSMDPQTMSNISSALQEVFGSVMGPIQEADSREHSDEESSDASKCVNRRYLVPRISNQHEGSDERSEMDKTSKVCSASAGDALIDDGNPAEKFSTQSVISRGLVGHRDIDIESLNENSKRGSQGSESMKDLNSMDNGGSSQLRSSMKSAFVNSDFPSPVDKRPVELGSTAFEGGRHLSHVDKNQISNTHVGFSAMRSTGEGVFAPLGQHSSGQYNYLSSDQIAWYFDGDSAAMDIFSASNQLWLGSLGPDASEPLVKFQFEQFGQVEVFLYFPIKGFALVEYRNIMDAIKAREHMRGSSPWGACLQVKFLDAGLGSRGSVNGVAVGSSCHVYVGNVSSQWIKDDILNGMMRVGFRHPRMVTDLITESALLMEFETAQEATSVMVHLRQLRKENGYHVATNKALTLKPGKADVSRSYMDGARFVPASIHHELRSNHSGSMSSSVLGSPSVPAAFDSPIETCKMRKSQLSSLLLALSSKYNISQNSYSFDNHSSRRYHAAKRDEENVPTNTLCMGLPDNSSPFLTDDELMTVCSHAVGNVGSIVRLTRASIQTGSYWFIEFSSVDAAVTAMKNIRSCPGMFFQIEFSQPGNTPFITSDRSNQELVSPIVSQNCETIGQSGHAHPSNWTSYGAMEVPELAGRNVGNFDGYDNNAAKMDLSQAKSHPASHVNQQIWTYKKPETELQFSATGSRLCTPMAVQGPTVLPPQPMQASPFMRPVYYTPNNSWDAHSANRPLPMSHPNPSIVANNLHFNVPAPPFLPASVTPLAQLPGSTLQHVDHMVTAPPLPTLSSIPPPPSMPPPLPPSPPPLPFSQPPMVPPPPSSPPLQSAVGPFYQGSAGQDLPYQWQGVLCKSGVHYCKIYARREDSDTCKYSNAIPEPTEWPARLDMTKRTDFQHVKSTFSSTPPNKREVCRLLPSTSDDHKGFQDFISYLKQRECAGVIKIPAVKNMWARLLFILPYSHETCSMIAIPLQPEKCLIALILPKETNFEWV